MIIFINLTTIFTISQYILKNSKKCKSKFSKTRIDICLVCPNKTV